jgi:hypothetical protein
MTYMRRGLSGRLAFGDDTPIAVQVFDPSYWQNLQKEQDEQACRDASTRASADLAARTLDLARNWKPTGFYTPKDLEAMLNQTWSILTKAGAALDQVLADDFADKTTARSLRNSLSNRFGESQVFVTALNEAKNKGITVIDAPGFKAWVVKAMNEAQLDYEHVAYMACIRPWFVGVISVAYTAFDLAVKVAKAMVAATVAAGQAVVKAADFLSTAWDVLIWGGGAMGLLWLVTQLKSRKSS